MSKSNVVLGTTLYSFTGEWLSRRFTLDQLVAEVARLGVGPGVEMVGFQSLRGYPHVSDEFAAHFRALLAQHGLVPTCLSGNVDLGRYPDRLMSVDETVAYIEPQIDVAKKLGFPVLRIQALAGPQVLAKLAPAAERAAVQVACELHSPLSVDHPEVIELRECYDRVQSPYLGFVPDFSSAMTRAPAGFWANLSRNGASDALLAEAQAIWHSDDPTATRFAALAQIGARYGVDARMMGDLNRSMTMFGHMPVEGLAELLPYTRHIHGKFYEVDEAGLETSIPYPAIMALLKREGYAGSISAEWEGRSFFSADVAFAQVQAWHAMVKRLLA